MTVLCKTVVSDCGPLIIPRNPQKAVSEDNIVVSAEWYTIDSQISGYCISKEVEYDVFAILIYDSQIRYLLLDDDGVPGFFPAHILEIKKSTMGFDWGIVEYLVSSHKMHLIGYPDITLSYENLIELIEGKSTAIRKILEYKDYVLQYSSF